MAKHSSTTHWSRKARKRNKREKNPHHGYKEVYIHFGHLKNRSLSVAERLDLAVQACRKNKYFIIHTVAYRLNISPYKLLAKLANSYKKEN